MASEDLREITSSPLSLERGQSGNAFRMPCYRPVAHL
jgi:hypothetical protein